MRNLLLRSPGAMLPAACLLALVSCAAPPEGVLEPAEVRASLSERALPESLEQELEGLELPPSVLRLPDSSERAGPEQPGYWWVRALAWSPQVRAARRSLAAATAEAKSAGAPGPIAVQVMDHQLGGDDKLIEAIGVLDLVGLLGLGPSAAERQLASATSQLALGQLELAAFNAVWEVERARIRAVAARARHASFSELMEEAQRDLERVVILERNGRLGSSDAGLARAEVARIERLVSLAAVTLGSALRELAVSAGSVPDAATSDLGADLLAVGAGGVMELEARAGTSVPPARKGIEELAARHPALREARLLFTVREARVREAAARAWPGVGLGPHIGYLDSARVGAVLRLALPFPSSWRGRLEAAVQRRDRAAEAFEERVQSLLVAESEALKRLAELESRGATRTTERAALPAQDHWTAARATFRLGRGTLAGWTKALNHLTETVTWSIDDAESLALARLDLSSARGYALSLARGTETVAP